MINLEQLKQELLETKNKCAEIEKKIEELEKQKNEIRWRAKRGETYFYVRSSGDIDWNWDRTGGTSLNHYNLGNYFQTKEEAKNVVEKIKVYTQLKDLAMRLNKCEKINWDNSMQDKYYIGFNPLDNTLMRMHTNTLRNIGQTYCLDGNFLVKAIEEIGEENLRKLFE